MPLDFDPWDTIKSALILHPNKRTVPNIPVLLSVLSPCDARAIFDSAINLVNLATKKLSNNNFLAQKSRLEGKLSRQVSQFQSIVDLARFDRVGQLWFVRPAESCWHEDPDESNWLKRVLASNTITEKDESSPMAAAVNQRSEDWDDADDSVGCNQGTFLSSTENGDSIKRL